MNAQGWYHQRSRAASESSWSAKSASLVPSKSSWAAKSAGQIDASELPWPALEGKRPGKEQRQRGKGVAGQDSLGGGGPIRKSLRATSGWPGTTFDSDF